MVAVAVVLVAGGCSGGGDEVDAEPSPPVASEAPEPVESETEDEFPDSPEVEFDRLAAEKDWVVGESASGWVVMMCESLDMKGPARSQWLADGGHMKGDSGKALLAGVPEFCPENTKAVKAAASGKFERSYGTGEYVVRSTPPTAEEAEQDVVTIPPGTYRTRGHLDDCYWERATKAGEILDNNFANAASDITVTILPSDGMFKSESCGTWRPVK